MKTKTIYICETCGFESESKDAVLSCEAKHLWLTPEEKRIYDNLNDCVIRYANTVSKTNNQYTRDILDAAVTRLLAFEVEHGLDQRGRFYEE